MITLIIIASLGALLGLAVGMTEDFSEGIMGGIVGGIVGGMVGFLVGAVIGMIAYDGTHWDPPQRVQLVNLADGSDIHGRSYFLGSGYVDSSPSYTWYEQHGENNYVRRDVDASIATVHYVRPGVAPYLSIRKEAPDYPGFNQKWGWGDIVDASGEKYDFYIPRGSITRDYTLDNK